MGYGQMKNLDLSNVYRDHAEISVDIIRELEKTQNIVVLKCTRVLYQNTME